MTTQWLDAIIAAQKELGIDNEELAKRANLPERTVTRILKKETKNPRIDTILPLAEAVGLTQEDLFHGKKLQLGVQDLIRLQAEVDRLNTENASLSEELTNLKNEAHTLALEVDRLRVKLEHKDEIIKNKMEVIAVYEHFIGPTIKK